MAATGKRRLLHVEGSDDRHALVHLLIRHGVPYDPDKFENSPKELPKFDEIGSVDALIAGIEAAVKLNANRSVGFVLDADASLLNHWRRVYDRLKKVEVSPLPEHPPIDGFIGVSTRFKTKVGVWLMPDNEHDGKLEDFLRTLIDEGDPLIEHAQDSTDQAKALGAKFSEPDTIKAVIHSWLAWQEEPGKPFGVAIKARYFQHNSPAADRFVAWFKKLYGLD